ncbi:serine hydrolase domain-containing protein [Kitasatospora sp. NPDC058170]|uniref:serine hydrolase domain-containing protein n=1 Tax=Kitasatospora sp. NPDC058170 TaxID=3346364 RepID=UPI0036DB4BCD
MAGTTGTTARTGPTDTVAGGSPGRGGRRGLAARAAAVVLAGAGLVGALAPAAGAADAPAPYRVTASADGEPAAGSAQRVDRAALDAALRAMTGPGGSTAALARVREGGRTAWAGAVGSADLATGAAASADGRFRIGSVTKTFVSTVVLQLVAEHRIGLEDSVESRLPGAVPNGAGITVRQLLNHTSGLVSYTDDAAFNFDNPAVVRQWLAGGRWTPYRPQQLVDIATAHPPYFAPGQGWHYSNTNYILAGMLIERTTGRSWAEEVERRIIRPLGLTGTSMPVHSPFIAGPHAHGYLPLDTGPADATLLDPSMAGASGAGISTTADLARFISALLGGQLLGPAELAEMQRTADIGDGATYGLGLQRMTTPCGEFWGHGGGIPGYTTVMLGEAGGRRQFAASVNPYDVSDPDTANAAFNRLILAGECGGRPPAADPAGPAGSAGLTGLTGLTGPAGLAGLAGAAGKIG